MSADVLAYAPAVLAWAAALYKLPALRARSRDPALASFWLTLFALALALTALVPPVYVAVDRATGVPNLARLLANMLVLLASWSAQALLLYLSHGGAEAEGGARRLAWVLGGTLALMVLLFALAPVDEEALDFTRRYADAPFVLEYRLVFLAFLGLSLANVARTSWRYAAIGGQPSLCLGLRLTAVGAGVGLAYVAHEALYGLSQRLGLGYPVPDPATLTALLVATGIGLIMVGSTMPAWGPRAGVPALCRWAEQYRACRRLYPLWAELCRATPEVALATPPSALADAVALRDLRLRLYRRVIEIRDAELALRPYTEISIVEGAYALCREAGLRAADVPAVVAAATLTAASRAKARGRRAVRPNETPVAPGGEGLESEVVLLERVARHVRSPFVHRLVSELAPDEAARADPTRRPADRAGAP